VRRLLLVACVPAALLLSGCALGQTDPATDITASGATFNGRLSSTENADAEYSPDHAVQYWFKYGTTTGYGSETTHRTLHLSEHEYTEEFPVTEPTVGLTPSTTYHYQLCADDAQEGVGPGCTGDATFTTAAGHRARGQGTIEWEHAPPDSTTTFDFDASSTTGQDASGTFSFSNSATDSQPARSYSGTISCLVTANGQATLGGVITASTFPTSIFQVGDRLRFTVKDVPQDAGGDTLTSLSAASSATDCQPASGQHPVLTGDIVVE
jgi:hypothetical protein